MPAAPVLSLVIPFLNEAPVLPLLCQKLAEIADELTLSTEFVFVDDGSTDGGADILKALQKKEKRIRVLVLSRNFGKEAALSCGLAHAKGEAVIPLDADLQDPPELIAGMVKLWKDGAEIVNAQRVDREHDSWLKRTTAQGFYRAMNRLSDVHLPENVGDFRLLDRKVVNVLNALPERQRFMKGLFAWVGFRTVTLPYTRPARAAGHSKFNSWRLWNFALEGLTSFSSAPLRVWTYFGMTVTTCAFVYGFYLFLRTLVTGVDVPGYASLFLAIVFFGGLHLMSVGLLGEYIGRIFMETKQRPLYVVRDSF